MKIPTSRSSLRGCWTIKRKEKLSRKDTLGAVPVRNQAAESEEDGEGRISLSVPRRDAFLVKVLSKFFFIPPERRISLDEMGSWVWKKCDGKTSVGEIINSMCGEFRLSRKEAETSLLSFLKSLSSKKLVGFMLARGASGKKKGADHGKQKGEQCSTADSSAFEQGR